MKSTVIFLALLICLSQAFYNRRYRNETEHYQYAFNVSETHRTTPGWSYWYPNGTKIDEYHASFAGIYGQDRNISNSSYTYAVFDHYAENTTTRTNRREWDYRTGRWVEFEEVRSRAAEAGKYEADSMINPYHNFTEYPYPDQTENSYPYVETFEPENVVDTTVQTSYLDTFNESWDDLLDRIGGTFDSLTSMMGQRAEDAADSVEEFLPSDD